MNTKLYDWLGGFEPKKIPKYTHERYCVVWVLGQLCKVEFVNDLIKTAQEKFNSSDELYLFIYDIYNDNEVKLKITNIKIEK